MFLLCTVFLATILNFNNCNCLLPVTTCGTTLYTKTGTFSPPTFYKPNNSNPETCKWRILTSPDEKITLNITQLDIKKTPSCISGYVEVRDGLWEDSPLLGKFCGRGTLDPVTSTKNKMLISYVHQAGYRGFFANYEATCGGEVYVRNEFVLHSSHPQEKYPLNIKCVWKVVVPDFHQVVLSFQKFKIEHHDQCLFDYVEIDDSNGTSRGRFCGDVLPGNVTSSSNNLTIKLVSDASIQKEGFSVFILAEFDECTTMLHDCAQECINTIGTYKCACRKGYELHPDGKNCEVACGGPLKALKGVIQSPSFPNKYPPNKRCSWEIVARVDRVVLFNFTHFDIEGHNRTHSIKERCEKDRLEFFGESENVTKHLGTYCGSRLPVPLISESTRTKIVFFSDNTVERKGFALEYFVIRDKCDKFKGNCHHGCANVVTGRKCLCSETYVSMDSVNCRKDCHYEIASTSGTIFSPNYPGSYYNNANCTWKFKTTPGHRIQISFLDVQTENCHDYINVYDDYSSSVRILGKLCGTRTGITGLSTKNELYVNFISDGSNVYQGFKATYSSLCGGTLTATITENYIYSHDTYRLSNYYNNTDCVWTIRANSGYYVNLSVEVLEIEGVSDCSLDFMEIREGHISRGKYCGVNKPDEELLSSSNFTVTFHTDYLREARGFRLMYKAIRAEEVRVN
ncbi:tolloid-like protein 1 isoform X2 [Zophobas morio]|uniref:tolloid-like protein 1 isoform X1 n=1 Tax=Zophobas morio TaxID=2755281 RepID=UPI0030828395